MFSSYFRGFSFTTNFRKIIKSLYRFTSISGVDTPCIKDLEEYCKTQYERAESVIHRWGHIKRTAEGAVWFVSVLGGSEREKQLAYTAGVLHDIVRPITEEVCHAQASVDKALEILSTCPEFTEYEKEQIYKAIKDHRKPVKWESALHQSVYLSDKILEHMGAYIDFRAPVWAGELSHTDLCGLEPIEAVLAYYEKASRKFLTGIFPEFVKKLVDYQVEWNNTYVKALKTCEEWAVEMAEKLFFSGRYKKDFEETLTSFKPENENQTKWADEMREYITGRKFEFFHRLLSDY